MKTIIIACLLIAAAEFSGFAQATVVKIEKIPGSMEELVKLRDSIATRPEGGAVAFLVAMIMYGGDSALGLQAFTLTLDAGELSPGGAYKGFKPKNAWNDKWGQLDKFPFLGNIYVSGTKPDDGYALPPGPLAFSITEIRRDGSARAKVFVASTGGNLPRPIELAKNDKGLWKVTEASSVFVGPTVMPPEKEDADDL